MSNERHLLIGLANADPKAFRVLFDIYRNKVFRYAFRYLKSKEQSEEIVQEVFLKIWVKRRELSDVDNFGGYLRMVAVNQTLDALKKRALEYKSQIDFQRESSEVYSKSEEILMLKDSHAHIGAIINKLPKQQRLVCQMYYNEGLKQREIAEKLGISTLTVKVHLREAIKKLKSTVRKGEALALFLLLFFGDV
ncbi:RNA polymerase sigma factor [Pedobacter deserti]|uniref:RNA polymerase sigma factor n=1 Tax=Pedobacter deserti TaxID=2817382 RepID=UPI00210A1D3B|nr:RNA polymerase sigma-70 factor [Pedobacter sp. SYSU D00382]